MMLGGVVAGQGEINVITLIGIAWAAAVAGDCASYLLGKRLGREFLVKHGPRFQITPDRLEQVETFFANHGGKAIFIGQFVGIVRAVAPFLAGSGRGCRSGASSRTTCSARASGRRRSSSSATSSGRASTAS